MARGARHVAHVHPRRGRRGTAHPHARPDLDATRQPAEAIRRASKLIHVNSLLENEPPAHTRLRRLVAGAFARGHVERLRPRVAELADRLASQVADAGADGSAVDLIAALRRAAAGAGDRRTAGRAGDRVAAAAAVVQRDREDVRVRGLARAADGRRDRPRASSSTTCGSSSRSAARPRATTCISSLIAETDSDGARLTEDELVTTCTLLLNAGHEATVNVVGNGVTALLGHADQLAAAAGRSGRSSRRRSRS